MWADNELMTRAGKKVCSNKLFKISSWRFFMDGKITLNVIFIKCKEAQSCFKWRTLCKNDVKSSVTNWLKYKSGPVFLVLLIEI